MAISSNSVIHFTNKFENLKGILSSLSFRIKYCLENIHFTEKSLDMATPMVCFCDIPLSEVKNHINSYGTYGIGLYKSWAKHKGVNPVLYLEKNSYTSQVLQESMFSLFKNIKEGKNDKAVATGYLRLTQYFKNYEGHLKHGSIDNENYRFYDEREWRYIPGPKELKGNLGIITKKDYLKDKDKHNEAVGKVNLNFAVEDISYIIIDNDDEIGDILNLINSRLEDKCTAKQLKVLSTKIITKNQIFNDF